MTAPVTTTETTTDPAVPAPAAPTLSSGKEQIDAWLASQRAPTPPQTEDAPHSDPDTGEETAAEDEGGEEGASKEEEAAPTFAVKLALPPREGQDPAELEITVPTQEAHDALKHTIKQASRVPRLMERLETAQGDSATVDFIEQQPYNAMLWIAEQEPTAGSQFLTAWATSNPEICAQVLQSLGYQVSVDEHTQRSIMAEAKLAKFQAQQAVQTGRQTFQSTLGTQQFRGLAQDTIADFSDQLGLAPGSVDAQEFQLLANQRLDKLYQEKGRAASVADLQQALQGLLSRFGGTAPAASAPHHSATQPRQPVGQPKAGTFVKADAAARQDQRQQLRALAPTNGATPAAVAKLPKGASLYTLRDARRG